MMPFVFFLIHSFSLGLYNFIPSNPASSNLPGSPQPLQPHTSFGDCKCDVSNKCDPYCCCDPDCAGASFDGYCLNQIEDITSIKPSLRMCSDPEPAENGKLIDWFLRSSLCIYRSNNPSPGDFYTTNEFVGTQTEQTRFSQLFSGQNPSSTGTGSDETSSPTPRGYDLFEEISDENNLTINFTQLCAARPSFPLLFGVSTSYECEIDDKCAENGSFNLSEFASSFSTQYCVSPYNNSIDGNVQNITSKYFPQDPVNCTTESANRTLDYIVQSIIVIYKSVGRKSSPQHIISDIQIRYQATLTDIQFMKLDAFNDGPSRKPKLRILVHFYEEPNNINSFKEPSKSDLYNWLPF